MSDYIELTWCISDGYASGSRRPQKVRIPMSDIEACETEAEVEVLVEESIQDAFERKVTPDWEPSETERVIEIWKGLERDE